MASTRYKLGLEKFEMGPIAGDGGMGTVLTQVGDTVAGSSSMTSSDDTKTDFNIEESDSPVLSIVSTKGKLTLNLSTYNNSADNLVRLFGGTKVAGTGGAGDTWEAPDTFLEQEQSIKLTFKQGGYMLIPRGKVSAKPNFQFNKSALSQVDISIDILQPTKAGEPRLSLVSDAA
jgi:hypothetical protein